MPYFGEGDPLDYEVQDRLGAVTQQDMAGAAVRANGGREFNLAQNIGYYALGSVTDLIDAVASSIPGMSSGLGIERQDFNHYVTRSLDLPGMNQFYEQNREGIEIGSGVAAIIGSELIARRLTAPASMLMAGLRKTPYLGRIAALDEQYALAMQTVRMVDTKLASRGVTGVAQYESKALVDAAIYDARTGAFAQTPTLLSRNRAVLNAKSLGFAKGVRDAAATEIVLATVANQNGFLYDDSASYNMMIGALGLGAGGALNWVHAGYSIRKAAASEDIVRTFSDALDPGGAERSRLEWGKADAKVDETVDWFGGAYTDRVSQLGLEASILKETPTGATDDAFTLKSQREALRTQTLKLQRDEMQKVTTKGVPSDGRTRFSMDAPGYGPHVDMMLHRDPFAMHLVESIGGLTDDLPASQVAANHLYRVRKDIDNVTAQIDELVKEAAGGSLSPKKNKMLEDLQKKQRRLNYQKKFSMHVAVDGEWMPISEAAALEGFTSPKIKISRLDADKQFWEVADETLQGRNIAVSNDLEVILPGGKKLESVDYHDALKAYRVAREAVTTLAKSDKVIQLPKNPHWFQLDMAEEILRLSDGSAQVQFPRGMTRDSAQVASFVQKAQGIKKLEAQFMRGKELFHGTKELMGEFDPSRSDMFPGVYFSDREDVAKLYGNKVEKAYANFKNPMTIDMATWPKGKAIPTAKDAMAKGHDGLVMRNVSDHGGTQTQYIALSKDAVSRKPIVKQTREEFLAQVRTRFNLPKMTAYERGVTGASDEPIEFLLRGMGNFDEESLKSMSLTELKDAFAQTKRLKDVVPATANDVQSLAGNSFHFMLDEQGRELKPLFALMRPFKSAEWTREHLAERLAARKLKTLGTLTGADAGPLSRELTDALFQSEDFHLASRPDQIMETHIQGSVLGAAPQSFTGALTREFKPTDWNFRDSPALLSTGRLRDLAGRITRSRMREAIEGAFGDSLKVLSNPRNAATKMLLNQFHSFRGGWDLMPKPTPKAHGEKTVHAFRLAQTEANKSRYRLQYGEEMPEDALLRGPDGQDVVLDDLGLEIQSAYNKVSDSLILEKNTLLTSLGMGQIRKQQWYVPPASVEGKHVGYVLGPDNRVVPGFTVNEETASAFAKSREETMARIAKEKPNGGMGYHFATQDQIREFATVWDKAQMDMINPGTTAIQPGKRGAGKGTGANVRLDAFENALTHLQTQYLQHGGDIVETLLKEQIASAKARANIAREVSKNRGGRYANANFRSVHDYYLESLLGHSKSSAEGSIIGSTTRKIEGILDKGLEAGSKPVNHAWQATTDWLGRARIWDKSAQGKKDFDSLTEQLGPYMPFKTAQELAERREAGASPLTMAKLTGGVNRMTAAIMLRVLETAHPIMNLSGIVNAMPSVIRQFTPRTGEGAEDFAKRIGHSALIFDAGEGRPVAIPDMTKIAGRALKNSWSRKAHADYDFMMQRGYITQEVAEFNRQFSVIETPGRFEEGLTKLVDKASVLSDKSEDFSRAWGHFIGLEVADTLGITGRETRHMFAHDVANKMIANYSPHNRPEIFQGAIGSTFGLFQSFAWNYYQRLFRYLETKDLRNFATQYAVQSSLFGVTGLTGWNEASSLINWASDGEKDPTTGIHSAVTGGPGDLLAHGILSQIPKIFGQEGVDLYSRGDTSVRVPGVGTTSLPGIQALTKIVGGIGEGLSAFWKEQPTLTSTRMAEIASNMVVNRPLAGTIEQFFANGNDTDAYGQLVSETKSWAELTYRLMGLRSERQSKEVEAFYSDKRAQEQQASRQEQLRLSTRAALREGRTDLVPAIFESYVESGGDPRYFRRWLKSNYEAATDTRSQRTMDELMNNPQHFSRAMRFLDMGVEIGEGEAMEDADQKYSTESDLEAGNQLTIDTQEQPQ